MKEEMVERLYKLVFYLIDDTEHDTLRTIDWNLYLSPISPIKIDYIQLRPKTILLYYFDGREIYDIDVSELKLKELSRVISQLEHVMINVPKD